jgi:excisionase family DNA binding protein
MENKFLTITELSEYINTKKTTIYDMVYRKRIPYIKIGKLLRFNKETIEIWIKSKTFIPFDMVKCYNNALVEGKEIVK